MFEPIMYIFSLATFAWLLFGLKLPFVLATLVELRWRKPLSPLVSRRILAAGFIATLLAWLALCRGFAKLFGTFIH